MESIEDSMDPRAKDKHEEEHEDSKKERKARTTGYYTENHKTTSADYRIPKEEHAFMKQGLGGS